MEHEVRPDVLVLLAKKQNGKDWLSANLQCFVLIRWMCKSGNAKDSCPVYGDRRPVLCSTISLESWDIAGMQYTIILACSCPSFCTDCLRENRVHCALSTTKNITTCIRWEYRLVVLLWLALVLLHAELSGGATPSAEQIELRLIQSKGDIERPPPINKLLS